MSERPTTVAEVMGNYPQSIGVEEVLGKGLQLISYDLIATKYGEGMAVHCRPVDAAGVEGDAMVVVTHSKVLISQMKEVLGTRLPLLGCIVRRGKYYTFA